LNHFTDPINARSSTDIPVGARLTSNHGGLFDGGSSGREKHHLAKLGSTKTMLPMKKLHPSQLVNFETKFSQKNGELIKPF
jgi:hypothetical protein